MAPINAARWPSAAWAALACASALPRAVAEVNCGAHVADHCGACPDGNQWAWCNGECHWMDTYVFGSFCVPKDAQLATVGGVGQYGVLATVSAFLMLCFACVYKKKVVDQLPIWRLQVAFTPGPRPYGLFDCLKSRDTCLYSTFCLPVVAAKNYYATEICPFWTGCILFFIGIYSPLFCVTAMIRAALSGRIQERFGHKPDILQDCVTSIFCFPCDVGRESVEIDQEMEVDILCCCPRVDIKSTSNLGEVMLEADEEAKEEQSEWGAEPIEDVAEAADEAKTKRWSCAAEAGH